MSIINSIYFILGSGEDVLNPVYEGMRMVGPYALGVVFALSLFYGIFLSVKYARCQAEDERLNAQKTLVNFIIGLGIVILLICILFAIRGPLATFING
ncbi:MAG: hypothetical protein IJZ26_00915 [Clostridia bacterium]|nr:hypothetical protein [Clostridia bacterium]